MSQETPKTAEEPQRDRFGSSQGWSRGRRPGGSLGQQAVYKEWAKAMRETADSATKMTNRKQSQRDAWVRRHQRREKRRSARNIG